RCASREGWSRRCTSRKRAARWRWRRRSPSEKPDDLRHRLVGIDAPEIAAPDPAADVGHLDAAPLATAFREPREDARFSPRADRRGRVGLLVDRAVGALGDDRKALAGHHVLLDPALRSVPAADPAPVL